VFHYGHQRTAIAVVDITGHGIAAALHAALIKYALRGYASLGLSPVQIVGALNHLCIESSLFEAGGDFFATLFFGIICETQTSLTYVSAGHDAAYLIRRSGDIELTASGPVVGLIDDDAVFAEQTIALAGGDVLAIVTDGFSEARDVRRAFLGREPLAEVVRANIDKNALAIASATTLLAKDYSSMQLADDVAALVVKISSDRSIGADGSAL
jgi:sigma-B regulation protein RsbU (phosphoserine phosphatase)